MRIRLQRFKKFGELSWKEQLLFSEAYFLQLTIGLLLKIIPFRWIPKLFSGKVQGTGYTVQGTRNNEHVKWNPEPETITLIKAAIQRASRYSVWKNKCLVSSLAARQMLNREKNSVAAFFRSG